MLMPKEVQELKLKKIIEHLLGYREDVLGVQFRYGTCRFIVFDFDNHVKGGEKAQHQQKDQDQAEACERKVLYPVQSLYRKNRTLYLSCKSKKRSRSSSGDYNDGVNKHFVIIDVKLVWHGGMNLLSKEGAWDNLMRIKSDQVAAELLEIALKNQENIKKG